MATAAETYDEETQPVVEVPTPPSTGASEEEEGKAPLLVDPVDENGVELARSPMSQRQANGHDIGTVAGIRENDLEESHSWEGVSSVSPAEARQRRNRRENILKWCDGEMGNELYKLSYAPFDLWLVYSIKVAECAAYYGISYVYTHYLTEEFGMTDQEAGNLYAAYGLLCTVVGICMGVSIDRLGVRKAMVLGCVSATAARLMFFATSSPAMIVIASLTFAPFGAAFTVPAAALGVRRYTHESNRSFAFSFFYAALCLACLLGSVMINRIRAFALTGYTDPFGNHWSWMRIVIFVSTLCSAYTIFAACFVRDIQVLSDRPLEEQAFESRRIRIRTSIRDIIEQRRFWRLAAVTFIFCGVRMTFRHMDATFPKYFIRTHGHDAPFEIIVGIEPLLTMVLTPFVTLLLRRFKMRLDQTLLLGAFISGISVFILAIDETYTTALAFVAVLAFGESIWSPKLYEFSTMSAPDGREGVYVAISFAPVYLASVPVGSLSGWALSTFCGRSAGPDQRHGQLMWFLIGLTTFSSFLALWYFRDRLFPPEEREDVGGDQEEDDSL